MKRSELKEFLDFKVEQYNTPDFISSDPVQIPHQFTRKEDIEISGFLTATISWGNRKSILKNANSMMRLLENSPYDFVLNHSEKELKAFLLLCTALSMEQISPILLDRLRTFIGIMMGWKVFSLIILMRWVYRLQFTSLRKYFLSCRMK